MKFWCLSPHGIAGPPESKFTKFGNKCQLTSLTIDNSLSLSLPAQDLPLSRIFPTRPLTLLRTTECSFRYASYCLWNQLPSSVGPSTSFQSLCFWPACSCSYHIFSLCQLTSLTIDNSLSLSLPAQDLPLSRIFPTIGFLPASGWLYGHYDWTIPSQHLRFCF